MMKPAHNLVRQLDRIISISEMIAENEKQTEYLQQYIKTQCSG
ncbi:hypothetical protein [Arsenophonus nasoniae]